MIDRNVLSKVKILEIEPSLDKKEFDVNFSIDEEWYQFIYYPNNHSESWFSDLPEEFEGYDEDEMIKAFIELIKNYQLKKSLSSNTAKTFGDIIDEL